MLTSDAIRTNVSASAAGLIEKEKMLLVFFSCACLPNGLFPGPPPPRIRPRLSALSHFLFIQQRQVDASNKCVCVRNAHIRRQREREA